MTNNKDIQDRLVTLYDLVQDNKWGIFYRVRPIRGKLMEKFSIFWQRYYSKIETRFFPTKNTVEDGLPYWREKLFMHIMLFALPVGSIIFIPNIIISIRQNLNLIAIIDSLMLIMVYILFFNTNIKVQLKKYIFVYSIYALGIFLMFSLGPKAPGLTFIQGSIIFAVLIINSKSGYTLVLSNVTIYLMLVFAINSNEFSTPFFTEYTLGSWIAIATNMIGVSTVSVFLISALLKGLQDTILTNTKLQNKLLSEGEELRASKLKAEESEELKSHFLSNISHEIRTPLNSMVGFTSILQDKTSKILGSSDVKLFEWIYAGAERLTKTVDLILNMSQLEAGAQNIEQETINLGNLIENVVTEFEPLATEKGLSLSIKDNANNIQVMVDIFTCSQAISNLIDNAIKYTNTGSIDISIFTIDNSPAILISDTGIGISEGYRDKIFEPFRQGSEGYTKEYQGIGLGLSVARRFLDLNNIEFNLDSELNVGTTITLKFPPKGVL
jgi:signal transduction histidine kinase